MWQVFCFGLIVKKTGERTLHNLEEEEKNMAQESNVVIDHGKSQWSDLWKKEDYLAIWLGFIIIAVSILAYTSFGPKEEFAAKKKQLLGI